VVLIYTLWHMTKIQHAHQQNSATDSISATEAAVEVTHTMARLSNSAIFAAILFPHLQMCLSVWKLPFGLPSFLGTLATWALSVFSFDVGQLSSPECQLPTTDPKELYMNKLAMLHIAYLAVNFMLLLPMLTGHHRRLHAMNAMVALYTIAVPALLRSCLTAVNCTWQPALDRYTLDSMPDIECWGDDDTFTQFAACAIAGAVIYFVVIPASLLRRLRRASCDGVLTDPDFLEANSWLVLKYRPDRYWFEIVVLAYKLIWTASGELLNSEQNAWLLLTCQGSVVLVLLVIVACERPFQDATTAVDPEHSNDHEHNGWTSADVLEVLTLLSLLGSYGVSAACLHMGGACESDSKIEGAVAAGQLALLLVPVVAMVIVYQREKRRVADSTPKETEHSTAEEEVSQATENPLMTDDDGDDGGDDRGGGGDNC
jgi:hypothetical protein